LVYVYADILCLVNFCFDFSLLYLAGRLSRASIVGRRLILGAGIGSLYGLASLYPGAVFLMNLPAKIAVSALMVAIAYPRGVAKLRAFATTLALFYLGSFAVGGAALAWTYLTTGVASLDGGAATGRLGLGAVLPAVLLGAILLHWAIVSGRERERVDTLCVLCRVVVGDGQAEFRALVDTGNRLRDPLSDAPVVIVEYLAVTRLLPAGFGQVWDGSEPDDPDLSRLASALGGTPWSARMRLVPFSSLGRANGLLVGFRPDAVIVGARGGDVRRTDVVVCVSPRPLSAEGGYRALVPPEILEGEAVA
jgi:stage II sporulation protein GA (sporulation sigma-E factor processing peptidase)